MQLPRRLRQGRRPPRKQDATAGLAEEEEVGEEGDEAEDGLDPEHPLVVEELADPAKEAWAQTLAEEDPETEVIKVWSALRRTGGRSGGVEDGPVDRHVETALVCLEEIGDRSPDERVAYTGRCALLWVTERTREEQSAREPME